jgi:hypothetical protein
MSNLEIIQIVNTINLIKHDITSEELSEKVKFITESIEILKNELNEDFNKYIQSLMSDEYKILENKLDLNEEEMINFNDLFNKIYVLGETYLNEIMNVESKLNLDIFSKDELLSLCNMLDGEL